jgi:hypothetical protein
MVWSYASAPNNSLFFFFTRSGRSITKNAFIPILKQKWQEFRKWISQVKSILYLHFKWSIKHLEFYKHRQSKHFDEITACKYNKNLSITFLSQIVSPQMSIISKQIYLQVIHWALFWIYTLAHDVVCLQACRELKVLNSWQCKFCKR